MSPGRPERGRKESPVILSAAKDLVAPASVVAPVTVPICHPERSEGSRSPSSQTLRCAQGDIVRLLRLMRIRAFIVTLSGGQVTRRSPLRGLDTTAVT